MSWHGPSAPRVEGIATNSLVVASCASNPASTASRILRLVSSVFMNLNLTAMRIAFASIQCHDAIIDLLIRWPRLLHACRIRGRRASRARAGHLGSETGPARRGRRRIVSGRANQGSHRRQADHVGGCPGAKMHLADGYEEVAR